ncbi:hypothetical protein [Bartonella sp. LJL80]
MTDFTHMGPSFPHSGDDKYRNFSSFNLKGLSKKMRVAEAEKQLADLLRNLENTQAGRVSSRQHTGQKRPWWSWLPFSRRLSDDTFNRSGLPVATPQEQAKTRAKRSVAIASTGAAGLQSLSVASSISGANGGTIFGIFQSVDTMLRTLGIALAIGCGSLPFVVYGLQINGIGGAVVGDSATSEQKMQPDESWFRKSKFEPVDTVDPYAAQDYDASRPIMSNGRGLPKGDIPAQDGGGLVPTAPQAKPFVVKDVVNGMALIEYDQGYWFAAPGSTLPDGSRYMRAVKDKNTGQIELKTSQGLVPVKAH